MKWKTKRFTIEIIETPNWKGGKPINPKITKWLVKVTDHFTHDEYFPHDHEFDFLVNTMTDNEIRFLSKALKVKEKHNRSNLKNPESREIEEYIHQLAKEV